MTNFNFKVLAGKTRALVCYCATDDVETFKNAVLSVFNEKEIDVAPFIEGDPGTTWTLANAIRITFDDPATAISIALRYGETAKRLRAAGSFGDVCVGLFLYAASPAPAPDPDADPDDDRDPPPSITSLVCDALRENFGGVYGASAFVIPDDITSYTLEVE